MAEPPEILAERGSGMRSRSRTLSGRLQFGRMPDADLQDAVEQWAPARAKGQFRKAAIRHLCKTPELTEASSPALRTQACALSCVRTFQFPDQYKPPETNGAYLRDIVRIFKEPMATEAHGKHGIFTDNFSVFRVLPWLFITIST